MLDDEEFEKVEAAHKSLQKYLECLYSTPLQLEPKREKCHFCKDSHNTVKTKYRRASKRNSEIKEVYLCKPCFIHGKIPANSSLSAFEKWIDE